MCSFKKSCWHKSRFYILQLTHIAVNFSFKQKLNNLTGRMRVYVRVVYVLDPALQFLAVPAVLEILTSQPKLQVFLGELRLEKVSEYVQAGCAKRRMNNQYGFFIICLWCHIVSDNMPFFLYSYQYFLFAAANVQ